MVVSEKGKDHSLEQKKNLLLLLYQEGGKKDKKRKKKRKKKENMKRIGKRFVEMKEGKKTILL